MDLNRRSFLGGMIAAFGVASLPAIASTVPVPVIYGDCIHDDTDGLQALFDGKPFRVAGSAETMAVRRRGYIQLEGTFKISRTLHLGRSKNSPNVSSQQIGIIATAPMDAVIHAHNLTDKMISIGHLHITGNKTGGALAYDMAEWAANG